MTQGLAVAADRAHAAGGDPVEQCPDRLGVQARQLIGGDGGKMDFVGLRRVQRQQLRAQVVGVGQVMAADEPDLASARVASEALPAADWYPDPRGLARLRYWDGTGWTDHVAD